MKLSSEARNVLNAEASRQLLAEVTESKEHEAIVQSIVAAKESETAILHKPQTTPGQYQTKTNGRNQTIVSRKETPFSYNGIDIV
jgi:hypothetical protein